MADYGGPRTISEDKPAPVIGDNFRRDTMKKVLVTITAVAAMLALGACATSNQTAKAPKYMTAKEMTKSFKKGSITCNNVLADGFKVRDFYYKDKTAWSGNLDRSYDVFTNNGKKVYEKTKQGEWKIMGPGLRIKDHKKKKPYGKWFNLAKTGKKSYVAYDSSGKKYMTMKCK